MKNIFEGKDKKKIIIVVAVIALIIIAVLIFTLNTFGKSTNSQEDKQIDDKKEEIDYSPLFTGVYSNEETEIYLFPVNKNRLLYTIDGNGYYEGYATTTAKEASSESFTFTITDNGINLASKSNNTLLKNGVYEKIDEFTKEDFYKYHFGPVEYLTSEYTVRYTLDDIEMNLVQISDNEVEVEIHKGSLEKYIGFSDIYTIESDGSLLSKYQQDKIEIDGNNAKFISNNEDTKDFVGTYAKEKELNIDDIIKTKYSVPKY